MTNKNNATMKYIIVFFTMMSICFLWIGYPYAPYKDFVLVCMIGQTYLNLDLATAFWSTFTIILQKFEKVLTLFLIPLVVGFFTDKFVSMLEKIEQG